jgi:hypothetical protein
MDTDGLTGTDELPVVRDISPAVQLTGHGGHGEPGLDGLGDPVRLSPRPRGDRLERDSSGLRVLHAVSVNPHDLLAVALERVGVDLRLGRRDRVHTLSAAHALHGVGRLLQRVDDAHCSVLGREPHRDELVDRAFDLDVVPVRGGNSVVPGEPVERVVPAVRRQFCIV